MIHQIVTHKFIVLCLSILIVVPFLVKLPGLKIANNVDYFHIETDPDKIFYSEMKSVFWE